MKQGNILKDENAVSISLGFILMFSITVIVFSIVVLSFYSLTQDMKKDAMLESYSMLGSRLSIKMTIFDTILNTANSYGGTVNSLEYEFTAPAVIAAEVYTINITNATNEVIVESDLARTVSPFNISSEFNGRKLYSGAENYKFTYDAAGNTINIGEI
ncbi:MAG: hypothetical protein IBX39_10170 [Candidatus Methanoperedenaceae archaeon]|nr:hypothetical protein [Candidatus Methanoperedenaceae archaeon]MDW7727834.1 hypothetical protein [Candidatus Methanoperedens sp.]